MPFSTRQSSPCRRGRTLLVLLSLFLALGLGPMCLSSDAAPPVSLLPHGFVGAMTSTWKGDYYICTVVNGQCEQNDSSVWHVYNDQETLIFTQLTFSGTWPSYRLTQAKGQITGSADNAWTYTDFGDPSGPKKHVCNFKSTFTTDSGSPSGSLVISPPHSAYLNAVVPTVLTYTRFRWRLHTELQQAVYDDEPCNAWRRWRSGTGHVRRCQRNDSSRRQLKQWLGNMDH